MAAETADRHVGVGLGELWELFPCLHALSYKRPARRDAKIPPLNAIPVPKRTPAADMALEKRLEEFLAKREPPKTFCPSEVARALDAGELADLGFSNWRDAMPGIRELAWDFRERGECEILQKGEVLGGDVRLEDAHGPIRIRRTGG